MMLAGPRLRVVPATIHVPLREVPHALARTLPSAITLTLESLHGEFGIERPRVAVAALNPHAGDGGNFGRPLLNSIGVGLITTAEGVEDAETRARLVELGVDQLQGYLIARPAPLMTSNETRG